MFQIRDEQLLAFEAAMMESFRNRGVIHLRSFLPDHTAAYSTEELQRRLDCGLSRAERYLFESEWEVMCFVDVSFLLGEGFDEDPNHAPLREILDDRHEPPDVRAARLLERAEIDSGFRMEGP